jgi:serine/threonine protein kinase
MGSEALVETGELELYPVKIGDVVADRYRVDAVIGSGAVGVVVAATHVHLGTSVAMKFLGRDAARDHVAAARLIREAQATARIASEHVAGILDAGTLPSGVPFVVMEHFDGEDLAALKRERGRLPVSEAVRYVLQVCDAVGKAHEIGIIHRDIKPSNVFLSRLANGEHSIKVLDFGLAKLTGSRPFDGSLTGSHTLVGSPLYMSPEQMTNSRTVDERTDIWSIGVLLFELLAGRAPFMASSLPEICTLVLHAKVPTLRELGVEVPSDLEDAILRCLQKKPSARFASVAELARALAPFASVPGLGEPASLSQPANASRRVLVSAFLAAGLGTLIVTLLLRLHGPVTPRGISPSPLAPTGGEVVRASQATQSTAPEPAKAGGEVARSLPRSASPSGAAIPPPHKPGGKHSNRRLNPSPAPTTSAVIDKTFDEDSVIDPDVDIVKRSNTAR